MALSEMYDFLSQVTPDYDTFLTIAPQEVIQEEGQLNQVVHLGADGSEEVVTYSTKKIFHVVLLWPCKSKADAGTIFDFYFDAAKANGIARSFKWTHPGDGHTYVVKFREKMGRSDHYFYHGVDSMKLKIIGRRND